MPWIKHTALTMSESRSLRLRPNILTSFSAQNPSEARSDRTAWLEQYNFYMMATEKNAKDEGVQVATLSTIFGAQSCLMHLICQRMTENQGSQTSIH